jgi:2-polyprenyl-3-methyl-5-hydroxy-6-metoxy-1,4-benzoquinol methylase
MRIQGKGEPALTNTQSLSTRSSVGRLLRRSLLNRRGKNTFIERCPANARVLDVGCGNDSPVLFKALRPDIYYVGLDVGDHNHSINPNQVADEYIVVPAEEFDEAIPGTGGRFDAIVSAHNLEHCNNPGRVLSNMAQALAPGGLVYLSFPSEASLGFPSRAGCLNFHDDPTHNIVPKFDEVCEALRQQGLTIQFAERRYRPFVKSIQGLLAEPVSRAKKRVMPGTWALYGFESVIWAVRPRQAS